MPGTIRNEPDLESGFAANLSRQFLEDFFESQRIIGEMLWTNNAVAQAIADNSWTQLRPEFAGRTRGFTWDDTAKHLICNFTGQIEVRYDITFSPDTAAKFSFGVGVGPVGDLTNYALKVRTKQELRVNAAMTDNANYIGGGRVIGITAGESITPLVKRATAGAYNMTPMEGGLVIKRAS